MNRSISHDWIAGEADEPSDDIEHTLGIETITHNAWNTRLEFASRYNALTADINDYIRLEAI